jgi:protein TonB
MPYVTNKADRAKAIALVTAIHLALGAALIAGLAGDTVRRAADTLKSFDVRELPPPPEVEPPPPPDSQAAAAKDEPAPPNLHSTPAPVVAPKPPIPLPVPSPVRTAEVRAPTEGADRTAGAAAVAGPGTGAGGSGSGFGGGGTGGSGAGSGGGLGLEARLVRGMRSRLDRYFMEGLAADSGQVVLGLTVGADGRISRCQPLSSSGNPALDSELCRRMTERSRWQPARDRAGRPVTVSVRYTATWSKF